MKQCLKSHVDKEAVLTACRFTHIPSNKHIVIGNTHLTWAKFTDLDISTIQVRKGRKNMCYPIPFLNILCAAISTLLIGSYLTSMNAEACTDKLRLCKRLVGNTFWLL